MNARVLIMAGGSGTRLWPYSTKRTPKQFLKLIGGRSSFELALERAILVTGPEQVFVSTNSVNELHVWRQMRATGIPRANILVKEGDYDTGGAVFSALRRLKKDFGAKDDDVVTIFPADHVINPLAEFEKTLIFAWATAAKHNCLVTLGKRPDEPVSSYGYMLVHSEPDEKNRAINRTILRVERFIEKPPREKAQELIATGRAFWNVGIFSFPIGAMLSEFCRYFGVDEWQAVTDDQLQENAGVSFDKMVVERVAELRVLEAGFNWLDIGSWKALQETLTRDDQRNTSEGEHILVNTADSMVIGGGRPVVLVGLEDVFVVNHDDALLVISGKKIDDLKAAMPILAERYPRLVQGRPVVTVCTPVPEAGKPATSSGKHLRDTVASALCQSYPFVEEVVVTSVGAATRVREQIADLSRAGEKELAVVEAPGEQVREYELLNVGLREGTGEILAILKEGDLFEDEEVVQTVVEMMEREKADVCWADLRYVKESDMSVTTRFWQGSAYEAGMFAKGWMPPHPTFFVRRSVYERFGYLREDMPLAGGYEFMLRVLEKEGVRSCYLSRIAVKMRGRKRLSALGRLLEMTRGNIQAYRAWRLNGLKISPLFILRKPFSKIKQIISKTRAI